MRSRSTHQDLAAHNDKAQFVVYAAGQPVYAGTRAQVWRYAISNGGSVRSAS